MRLLYNILTYLSMPVLFLRLAIRSLRYPAFRERWKERMGYVSVFKHKCLWFHAVSLGESMAAAPLIEKTLQAYPHLPIVVTNMTPTGSAYIRKQFAHRVYNCYLPYDIAHVMRRFFVRIQPKLAVFLETELWPNALRLCAQRHIPVLLVNARLSRRSARRYAYIGKIMANLLAGITYVAAQTKADGERFVVLGLAREKLIVTGNIKFDIDLPPDQKTAGLALKASLGSRFVWIAASTHEGEEEKILQAHQQLLGYYPDALLILVPRHPNRFDQVAGLIERSGFSFVRRQQHAVIEERTQVYLGDTLGELFLLYAVCDVAFVAGSFASIGGHNMLEAAVLEKPVLTGPHLHNFKAIAEKLRAAGALTIVVDADSLAQQLLVLARSPEQRQWMGAQALSVLLANRGAVDKQFALIQQACSNVAGMLY